MSQDRKLPLESLKYPLPDNEMEYEVECKISNITHELMKKIWGSNFSSPIEQELTERQDYKVLDVGCGGTCKWLFDLSENYPLVKCIGLDLSPRFPKNFSQKNLQFIQGDILKGLPFEDNSIDFVHMRCLLGSFTERQWEEIVTKELVRICKPGGWIELSEVDIDGKSMGPTTKRLMTASLGELEAKGINGFVSEEIPEFFESTNQVEVYVDEKYSPIGNWADDLGKLALELISTTLRHSIDLIKWLGIGKEEHENMMSQFAKEVESYHSYFVTLRIYCQKNMS